MVLQGITTAPGTRREWYEFSGCADWAGHHVEIHVYSDPTGSNILPMMASMAMKHCKECGNTVSTNAKSCPTCGSRRWRGSSLGKALGLIVLGFIGIGVIGSIAGQPDAPRLAVANTVTTRTSPIDKDADAQGNASSSIDRQFVIEDRVAERLAPGSNATVTNHIYKGQSVQIYEFKDGWARVSPFYNGSIEGEIGEVARWVQTSSLSTYPPAAPSKMNIPNDPRIIGLTQSPGNGLDEHDVLVLHAAARYFLETRKAKRVVDGDKSVIKEGYYFLNFDKPQNHFFRQSDIPDIDRRIAALRQ